MTHSVLTWIHLLVKCLNFALENIKGYTISPLENLCSKIVIMISEEIADRDKSLIKAICKAFCLANNAFLKSLSFSSDKIELLVYVKYKNGLSLKNDPLRRKENGGDRRKKTEGVNDKSYSPEIKNPGFFEHDSLQVHNRETIDLDYLRDSINAAPEKELKESKI